MRVLAIDGGGIRGIYASHVLDRIQNAFGTEFHRDFDLIAGTSTGSIIAAALAFEIPISDVTKLYREQGPLIFSPRRWSFGGALFPRYTSDPLRSALNDVFQDATLSDAKTKLIIPATDIGNGGVHVFKSAYDESFVRDRDVKVVDAVVASCSAPSYFAPARVGPYQLSDGGLWANNPSLVAVTEALTRLGAERSEIRLLASGACFTDSPGDTGQNVQLDRRAVEAGYTGLTPFGRFAQGEQMNIDAWFHWRFHHTPPQYCPQRRP